MVHDRSLTTRVIRVPVSRSGAERFSMIQGLCHPCQRVD